MQSQNGAQLISGMTVWVDMPHMADAFPGGVMKAEVIEGHRDAEAGHVWVRQLATPAQPIAGEQGGWVSEQPAVHCLAV